ncbi:RsmB/NOP family class I SAM-dependent RNA methyltransferase [Candidatus Thorarchaeota archaeon]|nr:MAG: RsmB/NOP family class I SAM-dependent RNA methyltransferase [Candidatus Thorarchaeota archaeon]
MKTKDRKDKAKELAERYGYLHYMTERYLALWGERETIEFLEACEKPPRTSIRVNTLKTKKDLLMKALKKKDVILEDIPWLEDGFYADFQGFSPGSLTEYMLGQYYVQGVPSMAVVKALNPQPEETVFDLAAAPGGKTTHIAQLMDNSGRIIAIEQDRERIRGLESNILRCGVENSIVLRGDARKLEELDIEPDRVLLDAPCSGEGLLAIDPERKTSKSMADIRFCATVEDQLLDAAVRALRPGGVILYSTCSIAPEEGEYIVDGMLQKHPDLKIVEIEPDMGVPAFTAPYGVQMDESLKMARRMLPHLHGTEGFFICKMRKE